MEHQGYDYIASQQAIAQYFDPKRYGTEDKPVPSNTSPVNSKPREFIKGEEAYPYQFSRQLQQNARGMYDTKQRHPGTAPSHGVPSTRHRGQDYITVMQQRQEYEQRMAQHQQMLQQREYAERMMADQTKAAAKRMRAETAHTRGMRGYGHAEQAEQGPRQSAFSYAASHRQPVSKVEGPSTMDPIPGGGLMQHHPTSNHPAMRRRSLDPRQYPSYPPREHYATNTRVPPDQPNEMVSNRIQDGLREWESHTNQMHSRETKPLSHPNLPAPTNPSQEHLPPDQFEAELEHLKGVVRQMEIIREQRDKYKSSAFQYLEKVGGHMPGNQQQPSPQSNLSPPGLAKKAYSPSYYQSMHTPQHLDNIPPKFMEQLSPQKSPVGPHTKYIDQTNNIPKFMEQISPQRSPVGPPNKYIDPTKIQDHQKQLALYQKIHAEQQRLYQRSQSHHAQSHSMPKKEASPIQILSQGGLPKIVDVRSLADRQIDSAISPINRQKRRSSEPLSGEGRVVKMRMSTSPDGYRYEIGDTRADSCDSGVESLASPESHINSVYTRNVMPHVQQQHLEAVKAQHAATFDAMKRQQLHQQQKQQAVKQNTISNVQLERTGISNVQLERAGSPRKLSELIGKEQVCPSLIKGIDSLTCSCQDCKRHQEKTETEIRDLYRERKIKRYSGTPIASSVPKPMYYGAKNSLQQKELIIINDNFKLTGKQTVPSPKEQMLTSSVTTSESRGMKVSTADEALDLSKKPSQQKLHPATIQTLLELQGHSKVDSKMEKDKSQKQSRSFAEDLASSMRRQQSEEKALSQKPDVRRLGDIITECLDHGQFLDMNDNAQMDCEESDNTEANNNPAAGQVEILNMSRTDWEDVKEINPLKQQTDNDIFQDPKEVQKDVLQTEQLTKSEVDKIRDSQVVLKVMVEKLKVNSDMYLPARDDTDEKHPTLLRTSSYPCFKSCTSVEEERQRPQSVGLANTMLPLTTPSVPSVSLPSLEKIPSLDKDKLQSCENERPFSAPPDASTLELKECEETEKTLETMTGHELASLYQSMNQDAPDFPQNLKDCWSTCVKAESKNTKDSQAVTKDVIPQNLKDCWIDSTSEDNIKSKELPGNPKMQWKAQWAKEKQSLGKTSSEQVLCEICGASNSLDLNQDGNNNCKHGLQQAGANICKPEASPQQSATKHDTESAYQCIASTQRSASHKQGLNFGSLFQPKQFQHLFIESTKAKVEKDCTSTIGATTPDPSHHTPTQSSSLAVINGKQHGKATIFHQPKVEQNIDQNNPPKSMPRDHKLKLTDLEKNESKHFPRLLPSPTAAFDGSSCMQGQLDSGRISQTVTISQTSNHAPLKNVLRVTPNVFQSASHTQQIEPHLVQCASHTQQVDSIVSSGESQDMVVMDLSLDGQKSSDSRPSTQTLSSQFVPSTKTVQSCDNSSKTDCIQMSPTDLQFMPQCKDETSTADTNVQTGNAKSSDKSGQSVIPTSMVPPMMKSITTASFAQTVSTESKSELSKLTMSTSSSLSSVQDYASTLQTLTEHSDEITKRKPSVESVNKSSVLISCVQSVDSLPADDNIELLLDESLTMHRIADCDSGNKVGPVSCNALASPGQCAGVQFEEASISKSKEPISLVSRAATPFSGAKNNQLLPKLHVAVDPKVPNRVQTTIGPPPVLISNTQSQSLSNPVNLMVEQPFAHSPSVCAAPPTSTAPSSSSTQSWTHEAMPVISETLVGKTDLPSNMSDEDQSIILQSSLENINRRLKSNSPHIHVPTANGFIRYQKHSHSMREIYRVEVHDEPQPVNLKIGPRKKPIMNASNVEYLQCKFPCVIRSDVPFVPPQMMQEAFFSAVDYSDFNYALQKCGILHRYMTMHEQGAMSRACASRAWNGSCKLIPLDEFDAKYEQMTKLLEFTKEKQ